jgi:periplasmic divalent cation tolerance protein
MVIIYTTCKDVEEAKKLGKLIIERKLAACVNIWPIDSIYFWEGALAEDTEVALFIKTLESKIPDVEDLISANHSYSTPFVGAIEVRRLNRAYREWMTHVVS